MDGIAAIESRIAMIQSTLATFRAPVATAASTGAARSAPVGSTSSSASQFASALATEVSHTTSVSRATSTGSVAGYSGDQLDNAKAVLGAGQAMGLSLRDQTIGVMTAMGESSLKVLDHGDTAGPDSRGLFQQRDNGAWGTLAQRMDPAASATSFFTASSVSAAAMPWRRPRWPIQCNATRTPSTTRSTGTRRSPWCRASPVRAPRRSTGAEPH